MNATTLAVRALNYSYEVEALLGDTQSDFVGQCDKCATTVLLSLANIIDFYLAHHLTKSYFVVENRGTLLSFSLSQCLWFHHDSNP